MWPLASLKWEKIINEFGGITYPEKDDKVQWVYVT
jgi:uncharacterized protein YlbG (UPF0298 family)